MSEDEESTSSQSQSEKQDYTEKQAKLQHLETKVLMAAAQLIFLSRMESQPNRNRPDEEKKQREQNVRD